MILFKKCNVLSSHFGESEALESVLDHGQRLQEHPSTSHGQKEFMWAELRVAGRWSWHVPRHCPAGMEYRSEGTEPVPGGQPPTDPPCSLLWWL